MDHRQTARLHRVVILLDFPFRPAGPVAISFGLHPDSTPMGGGGENGGDFAGSLADLHSRATPSSGSGQQRRRKVTKHAGSFKVEMISGGLMGP